VVVAFTAVVADLGTVVVAGGTVVVVWTAD